MSEIPAAVVAMAELRAQARVAKDWAESDRLRDEIAAAGFIIKDTAAGFELSEKPPFEVVSFAQAFTDNSAAAHTSGVVVSLVVDGWPDDAVECLNALIEHTPADVRLVVVDCGNVDGAGLSLEKTADAVDDRNVEVIHLDQTLTAIGWAKLRTALLQHFTEEFHTILDMSTVFDGDALSPLISAISGNVTAAGWRGVMVNQDDAWRSFADATPGSVDALLSYLMVVRRSAALATPINPKAKFYRNADLEWGLALRAAGGDLVMPEADLPCHQTRHHGYHDTDAEYRDRESKKTYDRLLQAFRNRPEILVKRS